MGVTGLWTVVQPCARPIKIETLNKKRLAVDASIWIYQFLKAVRDKEGNALRNSHVVGFFRRICKLLFVGILPVFVFDGGAPALKRQTISARKQRREGRKEDAVRTAGKLLALQMQRAAEEEEQVRRQAAQRQPIREKEEEEVPDDLVYVDELQMTQQERQQNRKFKKKDQYHLPEIDGSLADMGAPNDPRIMSLEELEAYARQFDTGEDINVYDFSKIDFDSSFFVSLPASDRYNILNAARLRSRLRMGYSKEQLDTMFPDRMAFSKFQIERVTERSNLTQRLMNINGMNDDAMFGVNGSGRVAGEKGREYVLVKNGGVEGGWALGVVTSKDEGEKSKPIDVDELDRKAKEEREEDEWEDDEDFEDVPIEGLNRLPKRPAAQPVRNGNHQSTTAKKYGASYAPRRPYKPGKITTVSNPVEDDPDSLFVAEEADPLFEQDGPEDEHMTDDEDLNRAIAMSLEQNDGHVEDDENAAREQDSGDSVAKIDLDLFQQSRVEEGRPVPKGSGKAIAHIFNNRSNKIVPARRDPVESESESESDNDMDFQSALAEARNDRHKPKASPKRTDIPTPQTQAQRPVVPPPEKKSGFDGPLPFEKLNLGSSLLGKKKMQEMQENTSGGFETESDKEAKEAQPLPPWFAGNVDEGMAAQKKIEQNDRQQAKQFNRDYQFSEPSVLRRHPTKEVIDLEAPEKPHELKKVIEIDAQEEDSDPEQLSSQDGAKAPMGDIADAVRAVPPAPNLDIASEAEPQIKYDHDVTTLPESVEERLEPGNDTEGRESDIPQLVNETLPDRGPDRDEAINDEEIEWSESDRESSVDAAPQEPEMASSIPAKPSTTQLDVQPSKSLSPDFEDVAIPEQVASPDATKTVKESNVPVAKETPSHVSAAVDQNAVDGEDADEFGYYSDSEDEDLMRQLAVETEEHARFASTLNHKTQAQNVQDYEQELKQLRSQQKKDRRDADEVSHIMITECQQLLKLFGLPYITAPMEAEAQCAELVQLGLVDGIVTDDSDCFLFGGTRIYKNMFNQAKFVECYLASDLEKEFDLTREKLIGIAQLLGSDYTEGLTGVGPVSALEILSEFPSLGDFKDWWQAVQMNQITKADDAGNPFRKKFRRNATKLFLPTSFPDPRVEPAYSQPEVDSDPSQFQWGVPDLDALRSFLMATIGWSSERTDEVLVPVIRDMNRRMDEGTQSNITAFFQGGTGAGAYAPRKRLEQGSKRIGSARDRMAQQAQRKRKVGESEPEPEPEVVPKKKGRRSKRNQEQEA